MEKVDKLVKYFDDPDKANKLITFKHFEKFKDTTEAIDCANSILEGKVNKKLKKMLKKVLNLDENEILAVADSKLATSIKEKLNISCTCSSAVQELMSCIRSRIECLLPEWSAKDNDAMTLGLSHG